jgi:pyruvate,water dikinase
LTDNETLASLFDERDHAVVETIRAIIAAAAASASARRSGRRRRCAPIMPSNSSHGHRPISVNPDVIEQTRHNIAVAERRIVLEHARGAVRHRRRLIARRGSHPPALSEVNQRVTK